MVFTTLAYALFVGLSGSIVLPLAALVCGTVWARQRQVTGSGGVQGSMKLGQFSAGQLRADLGTRTVVLDKGAHLNIVQGAVR